MEIEFVESNKRICQSVLEIVVRICNSVVDGTVTLQILHKIENHESYMKSLCEAITSQPAVSKDVKLSECLTDWQTFTYAQLTKAMEKRRREYLAFEVYHHHLCHLFTQLRNLDIQGWIVFIHLWVTYIQCTCIFSCRFFYS